MGFLWPDCLVVYSYEYYVGLAAKGPRAAFDTGKFRKIRNALLTTGTLKPRHVLEPTPVGWEDFRLAHDADYLETLKDPRTLNQILFLDDMSPFENDVLQFFMVVTGGSILAVEQALTRRVPVFNLGGGYHHAKRDRGEGFCPVNDVAVAVRRVQQAKPGIRILIVDLDYHQGNGTATIFADDDTVFTYSIHHETWDVVNSRTNMDIELPDDTGDEDYLDTLNRSLPPVLAEFQPDLVIYIAGTDVHRDDPLGTFAITDAGVLDRDLTVWRMVKERGLPLAVVAGGGYGPGSWRLYYRFICHVSGRRRRCSASR